MEQPTDNLSHTTRAELQSPKLQSPISKLYQASWAVFRKDLRAELRTRYALNAVALFAVSTVVALSLGVGFLTENRNPDLPLIHAALMWIAILFAAFTGLARSFVQEEEART
ncbi:MAG TPA: heme exporter protein CcmB, partial [Roseiflexaceae bacterium]|nr:heme exporter protein CcmB [Roseiflexaceae bacterium]